MADVSGRPLLAVRHSPRRVYHDFDRDRTKIMRGCILVDDECRGSRTGKEMVGSYTEHGEARGWRTSRCDLQSRA
jgi:hypothetical protein